MKPFKITLKDDREPTPAEAEWIRRCEAIINHPENAEPILDRMPMAVLHFRLFGHVASPYDSPTCEICGLQWRPLDE
jgi:hypothetical protein